MLLNDTKWKINILIWFLVTVLTLASVCLVLFVVLPNIPDSDGRLSVIGESPKDTSVVLFVFSFLATVACVIIICCLIAWWIQAKNKSYCDVRDPIATKSQLKYNTEERVSQINEKSVQEKVRNKEFEPYQNYGFEEENEKTVGESKKSCVLPRGASPETASTTRSCFAEDLYKSFKNKQTLRRSFLESVDEEGYHFDNIDFSEESEDEVEIEINSESKPPLRRLDTFDLKILDAVENLQNRIKLNSQADLEEEEKEEVFRSKLERSVTQESFKGLEHLRAFNANYLSLVHVDSVPSFLENEPKDLTYSESIEGENSFKLTSVSSHSGDKEQRLTKENPSERTSSESSVSSSVDGKNNSSELEWDATTSDLISTDTRECNSTRF